MGLRTWIQEFTGETAAEEASASGDTVTYQCQECSTRFEEAAMKLTQIRCPECRSSRVTVW